MMKLIVPAFLAVVLSGCVTNTITNLTPSQQLRNTNNLYMVEFVWDSNQQTMRDWTVSPVVMVGFDSYEMRPTLGMKNRWEVGVPIAEDQSAIQYHFKVDYEFNRFGDPGVASKKSRIYTLEVLDDEE